MLTVVLLIIPAISAFNEKNNELYCDFPMERVTIQQCLAPFLDKLNFGQFLFEKRFGDAPLVLCNLYDEYQNCVSAYEKSCRIFDTQVEHFFGEICSSSFQKQLNTHRACLNNFRDYFIYSPECFHSSMFQSDHETTLFRSEFEHNEIARRKCGVMRWYLSCTLTEAFIETCSAAAELIRKYYELLLNSYQNSCDLRKLDSKLWRSNFTNSKNITEKDNFSSEMDVLNPKDRDANEDERCDLASERYVVEAATELRKYEHLGYQLFETPFEQLIQRPSCLAYKIYKKNIRGISSQCRNTNMRLEKIYDYYCNDSFINLLLSQKSCIVKLHSVYDESNCSDTVHFPHGHTPHFRRETLGLPVERCKFVKWYIKCGVTESFYEACPQVAQSIQTYFELLVNVKNSSCDLRQTTERDETISADPGDYSDDVMSHNYTVIDCPVGFSYNGHLAKCIDVDECASNMHFCSQKCINKPGSYNCQCSGPLYKLARNGRRCYRTDNEPVLFFFAHSLNIWNITHDANFHEKLLPIDTQKVAMFDYDFKEKKLYYVDLIRNSLQYVNLFNRIKAHVIQNHDVEGTEGIAVDWIHRNIYTLRQNQLHVQRLDGLHRTSLYKGLFQLPRALIANPLNRELFASDWSTKPFIVRLAMDGTQAKKIITEDLVWPNALALDYFAERLYWADAFRDVIEMANLDGTGRRVVIGDSQLVPHVFGLTVFDDMIFWSDWSRRALLFADKLTGRNLSMLVGTIMPPYSLKAYHSAMQVDGPNLCEAAACQHICVPKLDGSGPHCLCTEGFTMRNDGFCEPNCKKNELLCSRPDHKCLSLMYRCDGSYNCGNGDDEMECPIPICMHDERMFPCRDNRKCILRLQRCDGFVDCYDRSDELYCADLTMAWSH